MEVGISELLARVEVLEVVKVETLHLLVKLLLNLSCFSKDLVVDRFMQEFAKSLKRACFQLF